MKGTTRTGIALAGPFTAIGFLVAGWLLAQEDSEKRNEGGLLYEAMLQAGDREAAAAALKTRGKLGESLIGAWLDGGVEGVTRGWESRSGSINFTVEVKGSLRGGGGGSAPCRNARLTWVIEGYEGAGAFTFCRSDEKGWGIAERGDYTGSHPGPAKR